MISFLELSGYVASFFVAVSLLMSSFLALRVLNLIGSIAFVVYGLLLHSIPVVITNGFITLVNIYHLFRLSRVGLTGVRYTAVEKDKYELLEAFVKHHLGDILRFFPDFSMASLHKFFLCGGSAFVAMKDLHMEGFALVEQLRNPMSVPNPELAALYEHVQNEAYVENSIVIRVDYVTKKFRGLGLVKHLYSQVEQKHADVRNLLAPVRNNARAHQRFLRQTGYTILAELGNYRLMGKTIK